MSELDPHKRAETLVIRIAQDIETLEELSEREAPKKDVYTALKSLERAFDQSSEALCDAGYEQQTGAIHFGNEKYYYSLFMQSTATNMLDREGADPNQRMNPLVRKVMQLTSSTSRVLPPDIEEIAKEIPSPFKELAWAFHRADQIYHLLRFQAMKGASDSLRGFKPRRGPTP